LHRRYSDSRFYFIVLVAIAILLGYLSYQILKPFFSAIAWGIVFTMLFYPLYRLLLGRVKKAFVASLLTLCVILILILGPFSYMTYVIAQEAEAALKTAQAGQFDPFRTFMENPYTGKIITRVLTTFSINVADLQQTVVAGISKFNSEILTKVTAGVGNIISFGFDFVLMVLVVFFLLEDGPAFLTKFGDFLPFSGEEKRRLIEQIRGIVVSTIYGGVTVALVQALIGGFAFLFLGIPSPALWGMAIFLTSFIPVVGTLVIWGPATIYLLLHGAFGKALILVLVGIFGISMIDNILRPLIVKGRTRLPTLLIFLSILGGIKFFGFIGLILGPLVIAVFISVLEMFRYAEDERIIP